MEQRKNPSARKRNRHKEDLTRKKEVSNHDQKRQTYIICTNLPNTYLDQKRASWEQKIQKGDRKAPSSSRREKWNLENEGKLVYWGKGYEVGTHERNLEMEKNH